VKVFLRHLQQHGFDLSVIHSDTDNVTTDTDSDFKSSQYGPQGKVCVMNGDEILLLRPDAQHTRNLHNAEAMYDDMVVEVCDALKGYDHEGDSLWTGGAVITSKSVVLDSGDSKDAAVPLARDGSPMILRKLDSLPVVGTDTHNKILRCGRVGAPLLTLTIGPYM
jgi:hypothetical protein